jgi:hypothetical protein
MQNLKFWTSAKKYFELELKNSNWKVQTEKLKSKDLKQKLKNSNLKPINFKPKFENSNWKTQIEKLKQSLPRPDTTGRSVAKLR